MNTVLKDIIDHDVFHGNIINWLDWQDIRNLERIISNRE